MTSREHTNFTYDLHALNEVHLAWFVSAVTSCDYRDALSYFAELKADVDLHSTLKAAAAKSSRRRVSDAVLRWHRHLGWYAIVRALKPAHVVETGTDKGLGTMVIASALRRNGGGRVTTIDVMADLGYLISQPYAEFITPVVDDSLVVLPKLDAVDLFIHDSLHTREHEASELAAVSSRLASDARVLSDNSHVTDALPEWAAGAGRRFLYWQEWPENHWYPGGGIGASW